MQREKTAVIYHASCPDGFGAAWAAHRVLGERAQYLPMNHGDPIPQVDDDARVYILDFSFDRRRMVELQSKHGQDNVILLDHHITAQQELSELPNCHFDLSKSGAVLSWEHFHAGSAVPTLLLYVQDKDLWTWELPDSRAISAYLSSREADFDTWDNIARDFETAEGLPESSGSRQVHPPEQTTGRPRNRPVSTLRASGRTYGSGGQLTDHAKRNRRVPGQRASGVTVRRHLLRRIADGQKVEPAQPRQRLRREPIGPAVRRRRAPGRGRIQPVHPEPATGGSGRHAAVSNDVAWLQAVHLWSDMPSVT